MGRNQRRKFGQRRMHQITLDMPPDAGHQVKVAQLSITSGQSGKNAQYPQIALDAKADKSGAGFDRVVAGQVSKPKDHRVAQLLRNIAPGIAQ